VWQKVCSRSTFALENQLHNFCGGAFVVKRIVVAVSCFSILAVPGLAQSQSLVGQLGTLLTEQRATPALIPDLAAATATATTVAGLFSVELSTLPLSSSSGGFVYRLDPTLGVVSRASDAFGPFFTERVLQNSRGQSSIGISFQFSEFSSLQGADLQTGTFPTNAARRVGETQPFSVDSLDLELTSRSVVVFASYGITDRLSISGAVPFARVQFRGERYRTIDGVTTLQSSQADSAVGLADTSIQGRYLLAGGPLRGLSVGGDWRIPTGDEEDLLGSGDFGGRALAIGSGEEGALAVHANGGIGFGGASREYFWTAAATVAALPRVTIVGEVMGRRLSELSLVQDVYQPHPLMPGVDTMRWLPVNRGVHSAFFVTGAKWNVASSWLVNANVLIRVTDAGLRARVTPAISIDYSFER
jgi:hypothetical protein